MKDGEVHRSEALTRGVRVQVRSVFVPERSQPDEGAYFFAYQVTIRNESGDRVQLRSRRWVITDGDGQSQEVTGPGVVGEQPRLGPGEQFQYTSACPLSTPIGSMHGTYRMVTESGEEFDAEIAPFTLALPGALH